MTTYFRKLFGSKDSTLNRKPSMLKVKAVALSHVGNIRKVNEDAVEFRDYYEGNNVKKSNAVGILCDGMGGHNSGEIASQLTKDTIFKALESRSSNLESALKEAIQLANKTVFNKAKNDSSLRGMGTTATVAAIEDGFLSIVHVGDSRAYIFKDNVIRQLTKDHTYVEFLISNGMLDESERENHPKRNVLIQALGTKKDVKYDAIEYPNRLSDSDKIFLCSDGLHEYLNSEEIKQNLAKSNNLEAAQTMIELALKRGGHDNISVLIMECFNERNIQNSITQEII